MDDIDVKKGVTENDLAQTAASPMDGEEMKVRFEVWVIGKKRKLAK